MRWIRYVATAIFVFVGAQALQPKGHDVPQAAADDSDNEWLTGLGTQGEMQCKVDDGCVVGSGAGNCTIMVDRSVPIELGSTEPGYEFSVDGLGGWMSTPTSDVTVTGRSASSHWNLCWKQDPNRRAMARPFVPGGSSKFASLARTRRANVEDYCYWVNGLCFIWSSPCSGGCAYSIDLAGHAGFCPDLRYSTEAEWAAALPTLNSNRDDFHQKCAAAELDPFFIHCDYAGTFVRVEDGLSNELVIVCPSAVPSSGGSSGVSGASAVGDPHLQNVLGERFDLMRPGKHVLIQIPKGESAKNTLLRVEADARRLGGLCADLYFQELNITGTWAKATLRFQAHGQIHDKPNWIKFGKVQIKVAYGHTKEGIQYLNFYVKHLGHAGFPVGGLLGEDAHKEAAQPSPGCIRRTTFYQVPALGDNYELYEVPVLSDKNEPQL